MVEDGRVELPIQTCKAHVIPFHQSPKILEPLPGIEPGIDDYKSTVIPFNYRGPKHTYLNVLTTI